MDKKKNDRVGALIYIGILAFAVVLLILGQTAYGLSQNVLINVASDLFVVSLVFIIIRYVIRWRPEEEQQERQAAILQSVKRTLEGILATYTFGVLYLENSESVGLELERVVHRAEDTIMALGSKSKAPGYLSAIQEAVSRQHVIYHRLINGDHITHELHEHLSVIVYASHAHIAWTPEEKYANLTVTENECIIVFPAPYLEKYSGLKLPGQRNSQRYRRYFFEALEGSLSINTDRGIEALCEKCSPGTARNSVKIRQILLEEIGRDENAV